MDFSFFTDIIDKTIAFFQSVGTFFEKIFEFLSIIGTFIIYIFNQISENLSLFIDLIGEYIDFAISNLKSGTFLGILILLLLLKIVLIIKNLIF